MATGCNHDSNMLHACNFHSITPISRCTISSLDMTCRESIIPSFKRFVITFFFLSLASSYLFKCKVCFRAVKIDARYYFDQMLQQVRLDWKLEQEKKALRSYYKSEVLAHTAVLSILPISNPSLSKNFVNLFKVSRPLSKNTFLLYSTRAGTDQLVMGNPSCRE